MKVDRKKINLTRRAEETHYTQAQLDAAVQKAHDTVVQSQKVVIESMQRELAVKEENLRAVKENFGIGRPNDTSRAGSSPSRSVALEYGPLSIVARYRRNVCAYSVELSLPIRVQDKEYVRTASATMSSDNFVMHFADSAQVTLGVLLKHIPTAVHEYTVSSNSTQRTIACFLAFVCAFESLAEGIDRDALCLIEHSTYYEESDSVAFRAECLRYARYRKNAYK